MYAIKIMFMSGAQDGLNLWLKDHQHQGYAIKDGWEFSLGRDDSCDLLIPYDVQVSREHAFLAIRNNEIWLRDNQSRNGTFLGEERLSTPRPVPTGELFRIGHTWLRIEEFRT